MPDAHDDLELDLLSAYLDGELDADTRAAVEERVGESVEWRDELAAVESARTFVRDLPTREAPAGFWDRVVQDVDAADGATGADDEPVAPAVPIATARSARAGRRPNRPNWVVWAAGAAAAVVGIVVVVVLPSRQSVRPNVTAAVTAHGVSASHVDPVGGLAPLGPIAGLRR
jgi:anti-sigma factor RsiW